MKEGKGKMGTIKEKKDENWTRRGNKEERGRKKD